MPSNKPNLFIYTALPCEAKPLIELYRLKKDVSISHFAVFSNDSILLTITGIGKTAMAAGIAYSQALFATGQHPVMVNLGIAGHKNFDLGSLFVVDKILDCETSRRFYPPLVFTPPCPTYSLQTASKPQLVYPPDNLCDMEASAFYETATRFSTAELIHSLKIVSDNESSPTQAINTQQVTDLIGTNLPIIEDILRTLSELADKIRFVEMPEFDQINSRYHFTTSEQIRLKKLISRWKLISGQNLDEIISQTGLHKKDFMIWLDKEVNNLPFLL